MRGEVEEEEEEEGQEVAFCISICPSDCFLKSKQENMTKKKNDLQRERAQTVDGADCTSDGDDLLQCLSRCEYITIMHYHISKNLQMCDLSIYFFSSNLLLAF